MFLNYLIYFPSFLCLNLTNDPFPALHSCTLRKTRYSATVQLSWHFFYFFILFYFNRQPTDVWRPPAGPRLGSYLCVLSRWTGRQTPHFRIAILPVDVRGGSGCPGNQSALKCGAGPWPRPLYKYPYGVDVNVRQPENMMPLCESTRVPCS